MWLSILLPFQGAGPARSRRARPTARVRLAVESLEDRSTPTNLAPVTSPDGLGALGPALAAAATLPFRGRADEMITGATPLGPSQLLLTATVTGEATHLGRFTGTEEVVLNIADGTFSGTRVFVAANGDRLFADVQGSFTSATTAQGTFTFTGGTGRFATAAGEVGFEAVSPDAIHLALRFEGAIEF
jgi:hypothetical protein